MKDLTIDELEVMLCATGYLPPCNEDELSFFEQMYEDYKSRIEDKHVDVEAIINGSCRIVSNYVCSEDFAENNYSNVAEESNEYSMAARNYGKLPKDVIDKMRRQHNLKTDEED